VWRNTLSLCDIQQTVRNKSVIVVGNNATALEKEQGELIDSYDVVIRFGKGIPDGYEQYLGRRTDIWVTGGFRMTMRDYFPSTTQVLFNTSTINGIEIKRPTYEHTVMYEIDEIKALNEYYGGKTSRLSAGAVAGLWLVNEVTCYRDLTFINFDFFTHTVKFNDRLSKKTNIASSWHLPLASGAKVDLVNPENHPAHSIEVEKAVFRDLQLLDKDVKIIADLAQPAEFIDVERMAWDNVRHRIQTS